MILDEDNISLHRAKDNKDDEFYTHLADVEKEMKNYNFSGKIVYCCCDNPEWSNIYKYFHDNFSSLGLRGLISSHYDPNGTYYSTFDGEEFKKFPLKGDGDCTSSECQKLAKKADVIVTNPPFSIFGKIVSVYKDMPFIMLCTVIKMATNSICWNLYMNKDLRYGYTKVRKFYRPNGEKDKLVGCIWYTNLPVHKSYRGLNIVELDDTFQKYDNYDAYEARINAMPDTDELIGIPVTSLAVLDPNNLPFEIVDKSGKLKLNGKDKFERIIVKLK